MERLIAEKLPTAEGDTVLDVGANIGNHSIFLAEHFGMVHSFEPNPLAFELLKINVTHSGLDERVIIHNFGLSDHNGTLPFRTSSQNLGASRVQNAAGEDSKRIPVCSLDQLDLEVEGKIALIKVDVEGHELNVLRGSEGILREHKPAILFEQSRHDIQNGTSEAISFLESLDYKFFVEVRSFSMGEGLIGRALALVVRSLLGSKLSFVEVTQFESKYHALILALHKDA
ncbi:FkbM family methyltransferase [Aquiluna sp.]|nr:FkbM family methyltransferase [Aquiluna sp.]